MRYASIDIETTGLDEEWCQVLEIGVVVDDTDWWWGDDFRPVEDLKTYRITLLHDRIEGQPYALQMNQKILHRIATFDRRKTVYDCENEEYVYPTKAAATLGAFLKREGFMTEADPRFTAAGKNFGSFDKQFLKRLPGWNKHVKMRSRVIDPVMLAWCPDEDTELPNLDTCLERAGVSGTVTHDAVDDAMDVVKVVRAFYTV